MSHLAAIQNSIHNWPVTLLAISGAFQVANTIVKHLADFVSHVFRAITRTLKAFEEMMKEIRSIFLRKEPEWREKTVVQRAAGLKEKIA
jgi:hypothetical protein